MLPNPVNATGCAPSFVSVRDSSDESPRARPPKSIYVAFKTRKPVKMMTLAVSSISTAVDTEASKIWSDKPSFPGLTWYPACAAASIFERLRSRVAKRLNESPAATR